MLAFPGAGEMNPAIGRIVPGEISASAGFHRKTYHSKDIQNNQGKKAEEGFSGGFRRVQGVGNLCIE